MSSIDLVILGMVAEGPRSAYDLQKDVEYHHFSRWTRISTPSVYRKVVQLCEKGYLKSSTVRGDRAADKTVYSITDAGREHFSKLMDDIAGQAVPLQFDLNVVASNLTKLDKAEGLALLGKMRASIMRSRTASVGYAAEYSDIPLAGRTIFDQQRLVYDALLQWLDAFEAQYNGVG